TGREVHTLRGHTAAVTALAFRADSRLLASSGGDTTVRLWEMENGRQIRRWNAHAGAVLDIAFAADGRIATCGADGFARLWQQDGKKLRDYPKQADWLYSIAFTPDATRLLAGCWSGDVLIFETGTGKILGRLSTAPRPESHAPMAMQRPARRF
ncbi:MAG: WD40 repeat domain-containing protein, partial [Phycisphaerae bacterium]